MLICHLYISFSGKFIKVIAPIYNWALCLFVFLSLSFKSSFHILDKSPYQIHPLQRFSTGLWRVFWFSWHHLLQSRNLHFNKVQLINYFFHISELNIIWIFFSLPHRAACGILVPRQRTEFVSPALRARNPNHWTHKEIPGFSLMLSSRNFIVLCFTSRSVNFCEGLKFRI